MLGAEEMAHCLKGLVALTEDQDSAPSKELVAHNCL